MSVRQWCQSLCSGWHAVHNSRGAVERRQSIKPRPLHVTRRSWSRAWWRLWADSQWTTEVWVQQDPLLFIRAVEQLFFRVSTTPGNPGNLLEFVWFSWKFCIKCRWSTTLVSNHDKTAYLITSLRNWSPFFYLCHGSVLCISCFCYIFRQTSRLGTLHSRPKQCKYVRIFLEIPPGISWKFVQLNL